MGVKMVSRVGQAFSRSLGGFSLAPDSMLLRLRRASLALLCLVGAVGLGLVIFISQLGWPGMLSNPLPSPPAKRIGAIHDAVALTRPAPQRHAAARRRGGVAAADVAQRTQRRASRDSSESRLGDSHELAPAPAPAPAPGSVAPSPTPSPPASQPPPAVSTPAPSSPTTVSVGNAPTSAGASKASKDSARAAGLGEAKSQGQPSTAAKDPSPSSSKSAGLASTKAQRDESAAAPTAPASPAPAAPSPAAAKEAADAAKAGQGAH